MQGAEPEAPDINDTDKLLDELLGTSQATFAPEDKATPDTPEPEKSVLGKEPSDNRPLAKGGRPDGDVHPPKNRPSEPTSENRKKSARGSSSKPSVKEELREITAAIKAKEADVPRRDEPAVENPKSLPATNTHKQPPRGKYTLKKIRGEQIICMMTF
jgi:hypothetical protein